MILTWIDFFKKIEQKPYFHQLEEAIQTDYETKTIYPAFHLRYHAFELTPLKDVRVVILGQDPYHQPHQAHGLAFSVSEGEKLPPSLKNIYKELESDLSIVMNHRSGDLTHWAKQGVLLLNTTLTVEEGKPLSHRHLPYGELMKDIFDLLNQQSRPIIFLLWGRHAQSYAQRIHSKHLVLTANHPSPLSANQGGWFGCRHFSKTNTWLMEQGFQPIRWQNNIIV